MMHKIFKLIVGGSMLAALLFLIPTHAAQNPPSNNPQTQTPSLGNIVVPGIPNQGENFLRESLNVIPDDLNEFKVGGGSVIFPPAGGYKFQFKFNPGVKVPPMLSCGGLNIGASLKSSLNDVKEGAMGALAAIQATITNVITSLPMLVIAYISPVIYEVLTKGIDASFSEFLQLEIPSCEDLKKKADDIAKTGGGVGPIEGLASSAKRYINARTAWVGAQAQTASEGMHEGFGWAQGQIDSLSGKKIRTEVEKKAAEKSKEGEKVTQLDGSTKTVADVGGEPMTQSTVLEPIVKQVVEAQGSTSTLRLLAGKLSPTETLTEQETRDLLIGQLESAIGQTTVSQVATSSNAPAAIDAKTTGGSGVGVIYNQYQANTSKTFAQVIININRRPDRNATTEDIQLIARETGGYMLTPQSLNYIAKATVPPGDSAVLRMEAALISALTYRKMVMWLMEEKGLLTVLGTNAGSAGPLQTNMINRIITAFSSIWSGDEMSLRRELMWAEKNVAEAMIAITNLEERRKEETQKPLRS